MFYFFLFKVLNIKTLSMIYIINNNNKKKTLDRMEWILKTRKVILIILIIKFFL